MDQPLVSIVIPAYNHARFIPHTLASLAAQSHRALELIVVDDGSTDGTAERVEQLAPSLQSRFQRVLVIRKENGGTGSALNRGLSVAQADFAFAIASDDLAMPAAVERLLPVLLSADDIALAVGDNTFIDDDGKPTFLEAEGQRYASMIAFQTRARPEFDVARDYGTYSTLIEGNYVSVGWMIRKRAFQELGGYDSSFAIEDWELLLRLAKRFRIACIEEPLAMYRWHGANAVTQRYTRLHLDMIRILVRERAYCEAEGCEAAWARHLSRLVRTLPLVGKKPDAALLRELFPTPQAVEDAALAALAALVVS